MTTRRQFIHNGLALSAATFAGPRALSAEDGAARPVDPPTELFIFDDRYAEAIGAARAAAAFNIPTASTTRFMTELWYDELDLHWKRSPVTLAGTTTEHGLFVVETLALDRNMRVLSQKPCETKGLISWVVGPHKHRNSA